MTDVDPESALLESLRTHNPWWDDEVTAFDLPDRQKSDFYHLVRPDEPTTQFDEQPLLGLVGRRGVGKTTLVHQFIHHQLAATDADPEQFCYLPFDADPLYQLRSAEQLRRAVRYYESRVLGSRDSDAPHVIILDDVHRIEHPNKPDNEGWGTPVQEFLDERESRTVVVTASAGVQIERELDRVAVPDTEYDIQPILPEKFRDYLYTLSPDLEGEARRISPTSIRTGDASLQRAVQTGNSQPFVEELRAKHGRVEDVAGRIQAQVVHYLAMGGVISYDMDGPVESAEALSAGAYETLRNEVRNALYQDVPGFESIKTIADLERLCALAARQRASSPVRFQQLVDWFDVDRRTIRDSYLSALADLYLLTPATEYDNQRPRSVQLYLRDTGYATALTDGDATRVLSDFGREAELARLAAFDHTMRFAYGINAARDDPREPQVAYWRGREETVDFVFELDGTPVPVALAYEPSNRDAKLAALEEFQSTYGTPLGLLATGDTVRQTEPVEFDTETGVVQFPYWLYMIIC